MGQWAQMVKPMLDSDPPQPVRAMPGLDGQAEAMPLVNALAQMRSVSPSRRGGTLFGT